MTYGEAIMQAREDITLDNGLLDMKLPPCKKRMSYKELCKYYNDKLFSYWLNHLNIDMPKHKKKKVLLYLLGRL